MSGTSSSQQSQPGAQEFILRAPGAMHQGVDYFLGKFPPGFSEFKRKRSGWGVQRREEDSKIRHRGPQPKKPKVVPLALEDKPGHTTHVGQPEGGITGSGMGTGYFVMVKEGPHFTVLPVKDWYNFRPATRSQAMSLEEAEKRMNEKGAGVKLNASSKLGALAAKAEAEGGEAEEGDQEGDAPDSDEERDNQRVQRIRAAHADATAETPADEDMPSAKAQKRGGEKGEDWEHEEERADDDLGQGDEEGSDQDVAVPDKKERGLAVEDGDSEGESPGGLTDAQLELRRVLQKTHLSSGSEDGRGSSLASEGDDDDDVDLDEMASDLLPKAGLGSGAGEGRVKQESEQKGGGKRKAATPPLRTDTKKVKPEVKTEAKAAGPEPSGPPTAGEILSALRAWGPVTTGELTARFRKRLAAAQDKQTFMANVKKVSRLEERPPGSGKKFVVPK